MPEKRQLAAIMFTDIVGYTALMGKDESAAYQLLKRNRAVQKPLIEKHGGKWLKEMGDGVLARFDSVSDIVHCAIQIQRACSAEEDLSLRIGIHLGEVIMEDGDVFGEGVNIASRIEPLAPAGGIYVSESVYRNIKNRQGIVTEFIREENLKNVDHPVRIYSVNSDISEFSTSARDTKLDEPTVKKSGFYKKLIIGLVMATVMILIGYLVYDNIFTDTMTSEISETQEREKSIAVLPFTNMSGDPEQEYFSDGMMEEILNQLVKIEDLQVTSRTTAMRYKTTAKSLGEIAEELGVATILEGSVRKSGNQVRITVQLIDGKTDKHLWSETYDRKFDDIFKIQSEVAKQVATSLQSKVQPEIKLSIENQPTVNLEAYDLYLEGMFHFNNFGRGWQKAEKIFENVLEIDPEFAEAYVYLGRIRSHFDWASSTTNIRVSNALEGFDQAFPYFQKALEIDPYNFEAHRMLGFLHLWYHWDFKEAENEYKTLLKLNPNYNWPDFLISSGRFEEAALKTEKTVQLNPLNELSWEGRLLSLYFNSEYEKAIDAINLFDEDSSLLYSRAEYGRVSLYLGMHDRAIEILEPRRNSQIPRIIGTLAIAYYHQGEKDKAIAILEELKEESMKSSVGSPSFYSAMIYAQMGEVDIAFEWLEKAFNDHEVEMYWLKVEPPFEPLHADPRWQVMLDKVGFPD